MSKAPRSGLVSLLYALIYIINLFCHLSRIAWEPQNQIALSMREPRQ